MGGAYPGQLAVDLDALVGRCVGAIGDEETQLGEALLRRWHEHSEAVLWLDGDQARVGDEAVLAGGAPAARWILPATMAGLHGLRPLPRCGTEEVLELAAALSTLRDDPDAIGRLRDRLWCGGVGGFTLDVRDDWGSQIDQVPDHEGARETLDRERAGTLQARTMAFAQSRGDADPRETARMDEWVAQLPDNQMQPALAHALRHACEGGVFWTESALETLQRRPELGDGTTPAGLWRFVLDSFAIGGDLRAEEAVADLQGDADSLLGQTRERVDLVALGVAAGSSLTLDGRSVKLLANLLSGQESRFLRGVAGGLMERSAHEAELMARVVKALGTRDLWRHVDLRGARDEVTRAVAHLLKATDAEANCWADLVGWSSPAVAGWILRSAPPLVLSRVEANLKDMLRKRTPQENAPLIQALAEQGSTGALRSLAEALRETRGHGWGGRVVPIICGALLRKGMGAQYLVPLFRDREVDQKMRLLVLRTLEAQPDLLAEAVKFQLGELVEPPAIKERLKAARRKLKEA